MEWKPALQEEIGNPDLFVGRQKELDFLQLWVERVKKKLGKSTALLARRRKGKTALLQRFFNILYNRNDPQVIPFYFRIPEKKTTLLSFSDLFYRSLLSFYYGYKNREPDFLREPLGMSELKQLASEDPFILRDIAAMEDYLAMGSQDAGWLYAHRVGHRISDKKDERIVQILDEFQYLDDFIYNNEAAKEPEVLTSSYQHTGSSKISPQIIAGSYVGRLTRIIDKMVDRYNEYHLGSLAPEEALTAVYSYARAYGEEVTDKSAAWLSEACDRDPYSIACMFESPLQPKDLSTIEGVRRVLDYETTIPQGRLAKLWFEYLANVIERTNDTNAKRIVLYLAKHGTEERNREQITQDLGLELTDRELDNLLQKLVAADILAQGQTRWGYKGLGDPVFEMVFRKAYEPEIARVDLSVVRKHIEEELEELTHSLKTEKGRVGNYKGQTAEYRMRYRLAMAGQKRLCLGDLADHAPNPGARLEPFETVDKHTVRPDGEDAVEIDLYAQSNTGPDLVVEVKDWKGKVNKDQVLSFIEAGKVLSNIMPEDTLFLFYSEEPIVDVNIERLKNAGILYADKTRFKW
ncbi:MAG: hypothetical protein QNK37_02320 [Acidobacteriota bacterium]|nr:hypothetical protein [Acidobacteriota bacterium]